jgi:hypothetical protein
VVTKHGEKLVYRFPPARSADLTATLTFYQPNAKDNKPHLDSETGGPNEDVRGIPLHWGILAGNQKLWKYGTRVHLGPPFNLDFAVCDDFAKPHVKTRLDVCVYWPDQYAYWDTLQDTKVQLWILKPGE